MTDVVMLEAALFQLRAAASDVDPSSAPQLGLCLNVLASAIAAGQGGVNAAIVSDIEFALNDLSAAIDELGQADADRLTPLMEALREDLAGLKSATALDPALIAQIRGFQAKLRERMKAIERQTYVEGGSAPLPHPPAELREEALPLARQLLASGFQTPALDSLIADPESLRFHSIRELIDELDVIAG
ncbi:MAG TPA: hypothetical protein VLC46_13230 [Thermoanaerobaculia bacterium]|jgi:hypothetical protein|nr:hypothetical protein [Thermoanaerobaculia bacterium]